MNHHEILTDLIEDKSDSGDYSLKIEGDELRKLWNASCAVAKLMERYFTALTEIRNTAMDHPCFDRDRFERRAIDELAKVGGEICDWTMIAIKADDALSDSKRPSTQEGVL